MGVGLVDMQASRCPAGCAFCDGEVGRSLVKQTAGRSRQQVEGAVDKRTNSDTPNHRQATFIAAKGADSAKSGKGPRCWPRRQPETKDQRQEAGSKGRGEQRLLEAAEQPVQRPRAWDGDRAYTGRPTGQPSGCSEQTRT